MVNNKRRLDAVFGALADPTRRAILASLSRGQSSVMDLARPYRMSLPGVIKHLRVLEKAGLVTQEKMGRTRRCRLAAGPLQAAEAWISQYRVFWEQQFDALDRYLVEQNSTKESPKWQEHKRRPRRRSR